MKLFDAERALLSAVAQSDLPLIAKLRIRLALRFRPAARAEMLGAVQMYCVMEGLLPEDGMVEAAFDFQQLIDAIMKFLPMILQIISLFT